MQASKVTSPSLSGKPPFPTDCPFSFASSILQPCSTASKAEPPFSKTSAAVSTAKSVFQVAITKGFTTLSLLVATIAVVSVSVLQLTIAAVATTPKVDSDAFCINFLLFILINCLPLSV